VATNELDPTALSDEELIKTYTKKQQKVERGFRFLKDPLFMASTVFLKSAERIMALAMIMTLSLLVYSALEHRIRESLKMHQTTFPIKKVSHPSSDRPLGLSIFYRDSSARDGVDGRDRFES